MYALVTTLCGKIILILDSLECTKCDLCTTCGPDISLCGPQELDEEGKKKKNTRLSGVEVASLNKTPKWAGCVRDLYVNEKNSKKIFARCLFLFFFWVEALIGPMDETLVLIIFGSVAGLHVLLFIVNCVINWDANNGTILFVKKKMGFSPLCFLSLILLFIFILGEGVKMKHSSPSVISNPFFFIFFNLLNLKKNKKHIYIPVYIYIYIYTCIHSSVLLLWMCYRMCSSSGNNSQGKETKRLAG